MDADVLRQLSPTPLHYGLQRLDVEGRGLADVTPLLDVCRLNAGLQTLNVSRNCLGAGAVRQLVWALVPHPTLCELAQTVPCVRMCVSVQVCVCALLCSCMLWQCTASFLPRVCIVCVCECVFACNLFQLVHISCAPESPHRAA